MFSSSHNSCLKVSAITSSVSLVLTSVRAEVKFQISNTMRILYDI